MALIENLTTEIVTAIGVSFGALFGGVAALIGELRKPAKSPREEEETELLSNDASGALLEEAVDYLTRTMWVIERRLSDRLARIEGRIALAQPDEDPPPSAGRRQTIQHPAADDHSDPKVTMRDE